MMMKPIFHVTFDEGRCWPFLNDQEQHKAWMAMKSARLFVLTEDAVVELVTASLKYYRLP